MASQLKAIFGRSSFPGPDLKAEQFDFLAELTPYCIEARYGDYKESLPEIINKEKAGDVYKITLDNRTFPANILKTGRRYPLDSLTKPGHAWNPARE